MPAPQKKRQDVADERFSRVQRDPRFWEMPEKQNKIRIDKRFQSMFHDDRFKERHTVDKRGRPVQHSTKEDLKKFYQLSDSEEEEEEQEKKGLKTKKNKDKGNKPSLKPAREQDLSKSGLAAGDDDDDDDGLSEDSEQDEDCAGREELAESDPDSGDSDSDSGSDTGDSDSDSGPDLARGKGNVETSSEEESEDEVDAILRREEQEIEHDWGDLCKDAPRTEEVSRRLAVCNMDWDRIKAKDLLALFRSFCPKGGAVLSVKIFLSDFGKERVQQEQSQAPLELKALPDDSEDDTEEEKAYRERMRQYQFRRLKYKYALVECDRVETAAQIYTDCDGFEYESSGSVLDLRFVPEDMAFEDKPEDFSTEVSLTSYAPKLFTSSAASSSKVQLTWDETDHERITALSRQFNKDELLNMDFTAYLASSSEEEEEGPGEEWDRPGAEEVGPGEEEVEPGEEEEGPREEEEGPGAEEEGESGDSGSSEEARPAAEKRRADHSLALKKGQKHSDRQMEKYRQLLQGIRDRERQQREDRGAEMEVTWVPGLKENVEQRLKKRLESTEKLSPWEHYLQRKQEQRKEKRKQKKNQDSEAGLSDDVPSDVDLDDPFFREELSAADVKQQKKKEKKRRRAGDAEEEGTEEELTQRAQMELLMEDGPDEAQRQHFDFERIVEQQNLSKNKRKKLKKSGLQPQEDQFEVDVRDPRFEAVYTSALFNLDPSHPSFKSTRGTQSLLQEKQRRRMDTQGSVPSSVSLTAVSPVVTTTTSPSVSGLDPGLSQLVRSIKSKTQRHQEQKRRPQ